MARRLVCFRTMEAPALRFLSRGQQLTRLQSRVAQHMYAEVDSEQKEFVARPPITANTDVPAFVQDVLARVARGQERMTDIQLMFQMFYCRHVDNFQIFLEELARDISSAHEALLDAVKVKNAEKYTPEERRVHRLRRLSFLSLRELTELFASSIQFKLFVDDAAFRTVEVLYDLRNLITHNYGIADQFFVDRNPSFGLREGQPFTFTLEFIQQSFNSLIQLSGDIQRRAQERFNLWRTAA